MKEISVLVGAGSIGQAIIRRVSAGKHIVLADYSEENAKRTAKTLENAGFECSTIQCDLGNKEDILVLVEFATSKGEVKHMVNAAGVSPSQAPVEEILRVDLYGTSVLMEEFGKVMANGGSGIIISSQSGHRLPALPQEQNDALAMSPVEELMRLPFIKEINDTLKAYQYSNVAMCSEWPTKHVAGQSVVLLSTASRLASSSPHWLMMSCTALVQKVILI